MKVIQNRLTHEFFTPPKFALQISSIAQLSFASIDFCKQEQGGTGNNREKQGPPWKLVALINMKFASSSSSSLESRKQHQYSSVSH